MSSQSSKDQQVFSPFFKLFEWAYDVEFKRDQKEQIKGDIQTGWSNSDDSDKELLSYILELHDFVFGRGKSQHERLKPKTRAILKEMFSTPGTNDQARIIERIYNSIEELSPGVTEVVILPKPKFSSRTQTPITPPPTAPQAPSQGSLPDDADYMRMQQKAQQNQLNMMFLSNMERMRSDTLKHIIGNIR